MATSNGLSVFVAAPVDRREVGDHRRRAHEERGLAEQLATIDQPAGTALLDALTYADMTTGPQGQFVAAADRIAEILSRYGPDDPVHRAVTRSRADLLAAVKRTEDRLDAVDDSPEVGRRAVL